ncbi:MAG: hypothetical protein KAT34_09240 [Candidatus Aminicenantes bacterium]|nr:hypothetical protein [Candidatus Aminicenantes bacterium]
MINKTRYTEKLKPYITDKCEENKISVTMEMDIPAKNYLVIKVDNFYNELGLKNTPPSVDCLILLKCADNSFFICLIELKDIKSPGGFSVDNIYIKFKTTIENFMGSRFKNIFQNKRFIVKKLQIFFVTDPYGDKNSKRSRKREGTKLDTLLSRTPFQFRGKRYLVKHKLPNPIIQKC